MSAEVLMIVWWNLQCGRYFEGGVSSVYLWDLDDGGFAGVVLLKKSMLFVSFLSTYPFILIVLSDDP
jgi:hypothetical protein